MRRSWCLLIACLIGFAWGGAVLAAMASQKPLDAAKSSKGETTKAKAEKVKEVTPKSEQSEGQGLEKKGAVPAKAKDGHPAAKAAEAKGCKKPAGKESTAKGAQGSEPPTATVKKEPFKIDVCLTGSFEAQEMTPVVLRTDVWTSFVVLKAVEHGSRVKRGDLLVSLELDKIDEAITDLRRECELADLAIRQSEEEIRGLESLTPLDLTAAQRAKRESDEDLEFFLKTGKPLSKKLAAFLLEQAQQNLDYQKEELQQLEKMYKADDLTEETEAIVLRRGRDAVKRAQFRVEFMKVYHDRAMAVELPREETRVSEAAQRQTFSARGAEVLLPLTLAKRRLELEKAKVQRARNEERLTKLLADRTAMTIRSPTDGIVYYGECEYGRFSGVASAANQLQRGGRLSSDNVFMTIVKARPMRVVAPVPERHLHEIHTGLAAKVEPTGYPDLKLSAIVSDVIPVPTGEAGFQARLTLSLDDKAEPLMPGMTCTVKLVVYQKKDALTLPTEAVKSEPLDEDARFVYLVQKDGKSKKHPVTVGKEDDEKIEILKGLSAGDKVLLKAPKDPN